MSGEHLDILRVELDLREVAYIYLGEVILVEITGHHLVILQDMLVFNSFLVPNTYHAVLICLS